MPDRSGRGGRGRGVGARVGRLSAGWLLGAVLAACAAPPAGAPLSAPTPRLGTPLAPGQAEADPTVFPDGRGLPPGQGTASQGQVLYQARCAACHGEAGQGGPGGRLVGRGPAWPDKTIGQYWPHATTVFDYVRRAMPPDRPGSLTDDQAYALTAYLLHANGVIAADEVMSSRSLPGVPMPNRHGFEHNPGGVRRP